MYIPVFQLSDGCWPSVPGESNFSIDVVRRLPPEELGDRSQFGLKTKGSTVFSLRRLTGSKVNAAGGQDMLRSR